MVEIIHYQRSRPSEFLKIASILRHGLGQLALRIDHIGSTSMASTPPSDGATTALGNCPFNDHLIARISQPVQGTVAQNRIIKEPKPLFPAIPPSSLV